MAPEWWAKVSELVGRKAPAEDVVSPPSVGSEGSGAEIADSPPGSAEPGRGWWDFVLRPLPLGMFVVGTLLTASTELVGIWCVLGYLLLVTAPVLYWLSRIEDRLTLLLRSRVGKRE